MTMKRLRFGFMPGLALLIVDIGIAFAQLTNGQSADGHSPTLSGAEYSARADAALYRAKQAGRDGYALDIIPSSLDN